MPIEWHRHSTVLGIFVPIDDKSNPCDSVDTIRCGARTPKRNFMQNKNPDTWVVYVMTIQKAEDDGLRRSVCTQREWDAMEVARPGLHQLIQTGLANESEAELLARGVSGDPKPRASKPR